MSQPTTERRPRRPPRTPAVCSSHSLWCYANHPECWPDRLYRWPPPKAFIVHLARKSR